MPLAAGARLGPYKVTSLIGVGGMGEVYKARDTRLDRTVAIKILPTQLSADPERRARFEREAKIISALNHPHICTLYDVGGVVQGNRSSGETERSPRPHVAGPPYLVMEYLEGETLADRLRKGPLPLPQALDCATQIADALAAAHKHDVIHRDLKPGNIMLARSGGPSGPPIVKLLDFGLAKLKGHGEQPAAAHLISAPTQSTPLTAGGVILGTLQYMAPEQLEGRAADARTDLWALGTILYEMLTGKRAFEGASAASLITAIMSAEPQTLATLQPLTPPAVDRLVRQCLAKSPDDRPDTAHDVATVLRWMHESGGLVGWAVVPSVGTRRPWRSAAGVILGAVCLAAVAVAVWRVAQPQTPAPAPRIFKFVQLTDLPGQERFPSLAPDGKSVVYASRATGNWDIYLQRVGGRNPINLTRESLADDSEPVLSPDGESIAFRSERAGGGIFIMGGTGESVRRLTDAGHNPAWSPDGREIAYATEGVSGPRTRNAVSQLWTVTVSSGERRLISQGDAVQPHWSPHGQRIAFWRYKGGQRDLATVPSRGGTSVEVTNDTAMDWNPVWSPDGRYLYFSSNRGGGMNLWRVPIEEGSGGVLAEAEPVTTPSPSSGFLSFSRDGMLLAYADSISTSRIQRMDFDVVNGRSVGQPVTVTSLVSQDVSCSDDGRWLAIVSGRNQDDIFVIRADGTELRQLTDDPYRDIGPRWFPGSKRILFYSNRSGRYQVWTINADGSGRRQLTEAADEMWYPALSADGKRVAAFDSRARTTSIFDASVPWNEQSPELLPALDEPEGRFVPWSWSPDGRRLLGSALLADGRLQGFFVYSFEDRRFKNLLGGAPTLPSGGTQASLGVWLRDSRQVILPLGDTLQLIDSRSGEARGILSVSPHSARYLSISADNRTIYFVVDQEEGDIWLASLK